MPRIKSKKKEYKAKDLGPWIAGKMRTEKITQQDIAKELGISQPAVGKKLEKGNFQYYELLVVIEKLKCTDDEILHLMKAR